MVRNISKMPALFRRSENGKYYFRRTVGTRRITINTGTANHVEAEKFLKNYLSCENASTVMAKHAPNVSQIANAFALAAVGKDLERTALIYGKNILLHITLIASGIERCFRFIFCVFLCGAGIKCHLS